jgi:hypothetical protein
MLRNFTDSFLWKLRRYGKFKWNWLPSAGKYGGILGGINLDRFDVVGFNCGKFYLRSMVFDKKIILQKIRWLMVL